MQRAWARLSHDVYHSRVFTSPDNNESRYAHETQIVLLESILTLSLRNLT